MKAFSTLLAVGFALASLSLSGAVITVNSNGGAQYTNLQSAMNDAAAGDTLLVSGEFNTTYYIDKELHLFGSGLGNGQDYGLPRAFVNNFRLRSVTAGVTPNGSVISGFESNYIYQIDQNFLLEDVLIERNEINTDITLYYALSDIRIRNNVIQRRINLCQYNATPMVDVVVENNLIEGYVRSFDRDATGLTLQNNVFADDGQETVLDDVNGATINNNVFWRQSPGTDPANHCSGCSFNHNLVYYVNEGVSDVYIANPISGIYGNNVGANNILLNDLSDLDDPIFVNYANPGGANWSETYDYHLDDSSPNGLLGVGAGTDGTNVGIFGGAHPMPDRILPQIPHVTNISSPQSSVPAGGTFQIDFSATKKD